MEDLQQLYIDEGYPSKTKFIAITRKLRSQGKLSATPNEVKQYLEGSAISVFDEPAPADSGTYEYPQYDYALIIDLLDMNNIKSKNQQYNWILNILEHHSRFVWSFPLKSKSSTVDGLNNPIAAGIKSVIEQIDPDGIANILLVSDQGKEFKGNVSSMLEDYPYVFRLYSTDERKSTTPVEVFNKTLRGYIKRAQATSGNLNWIDHLQKIISVYNSSPHTGNLDDFASSDIPVERLLSIKNDLLNDIRHTEINLDGIPERKYADGTKVRLAQKIDLFDKKSMVPKLSSMIYEVVGFEHTYYKLKDTNGKIIRAIESRLRPTTAANQSTITPIGDQLREEQRHNTTQRRLAKEILSPKSIDNEVVIDDEGRERVQIKKRRLPAREKRDKTAANARIAAQFKGKK